MDTTPPLLNRRQFLANSAKAGLVLGSPGVLRAATRTTPSDTLNVAIVGFGRWAERLLYQMMNIPGLHFQAVCEISKFRTKKFRVHTRHIPDATSEGFYTDIDDMLEKEKGLDAAIIATPDFWHAPHAVRCMEAGLHVYCESMMAHTLEAARDIVRTSERTGRLCQIGHQHRSSAVYRFIRDLWLQEHRICGNIHNINSQWNISINALADVGGGQSRFSKFILVDSDILKRYGYEDMHALLNWHSHRPYTQGRLAFFTARQMDVIHWLLDLVPKSVSVSAGRDFYKHREMFDNMMCVFQYDTPHGAVRAFHQSLGTMNDPEIRYEKFIGQDATLRILGAGERAEIRNRTSNDDSGLKLARLEKRGVIRRSQKTPCYLQQENVDSEMGVLSHETTPPIPYELPGKAPRPALEAHLMNFFEAIHGRAKLNCDARSAFQSEAAIYWLHAAAESGETLRFTPDQLAV
jgi:predicted dehydrogenase